MLKKHSFKAFLTEVFDKKYHYNPNYMQKYREECLKEGNAIFDAIISDTKNTNKTFYLKDLNTLPEHLKKKYAKVYIDVDKSIKDLDVYGYYGRGITTDDRGKIVREVISFWEKKEQHRDTFVHEWTHKKQHILLNATDENYMTSKSSILTGLITILEIIGLLSFWHFLIRFFNKSQTREQDIMNMTRSL